MGIAILYSPSRHPGEIVIQASSNWTYSFYSLPDGPNQYKSCVSIMFAFALCIKRVPLRTEYLLVKNTDSMVVHTVYIEFFEVRSTHYAFLMILDEDTK